MNDVLALIWLCWLYPYSVSHLQMWQIDWVLPMTMFYIQYIYIDQRKHTEIQGKKELRDKGVMYNSLHWMFRTSLDSSRWSLFGRQKIHKYLKRTQPYSQVNSKEYVIIYNPSNGKKFINSLDGSANIHSCYPMYNEQCNIIHSIPFSGYARLASASACFTALSIHSHETVLFFSSFLFANEIRV